VRDLPIESLTDHDRLVVRETRDEIASTPPPKDFGYLGCPVAVLGVIILLSWVKVVEAVPALSFFTPFIMLAGVLMVVAGPIAGFTAGGFVRGAATAAAEAAIAHLESGDAERDVTLRAATLLISHAFVSQGATTSEAFQVEEVAARIRDVLPLVLAVEAYLVEQDGVYPVFTAE
jgi:hypothetical protein